MNLATARSARRAKEIGLRKVSGAIRGHIILQFLSESVLISFLALLIAMGLVWLFLPLFNDLAGKKIVIDYLDIKLWLGLIGIAFVTGIVSGSYPALFLSGFNPVKVLKGNMKAMGGNLLFRNMLVITQFIVSILLLIGTITIYNQLKYIRNRNPGFEKDNLVYIPLTGDLHNKMQALKDELQQNRLTSNYSVVSDLPTNLMNGTISVEWTGKDPKSQTIFPNVEIDENFIQAFKMKMISGRSFSKAYPSDSNNYVVNEKALSIMGMNASNAVGKPLSLWGRKGMIIGVVKDFNFKPVQQAIEPLILYSNRGNSSYVVVRASGENIEPTIKALEKIEQGLNPAYPFKYDFLDQDLANMYKGEQQMGSIFNLFAGLAIFISCLGLYGLSAFMAEQRTKEIGVRKVLGASLLNIVTMLSGGITRLIAIAIVIAIPLSWYAANTWLNGFAYHISVSWLLFFIASLSALLIAWITVSYETIKAAMANPIKSIKAE
jgi:ABC-type antimicrobial peptide transport system permease subunit